jgi:hypothetical protein
MAIKPVALDLCKGLGGATRGLKAAGFFVVAVDNTDWSQTPGYVEPDVFFLADVRKFEPKKHLPALKVDFVWASPPCQEFSYSSFPFKKAREKFTKDNPPDRSIWDACVRIAKELNAPLILENVRGAEKWMGKAQRHYGSFYLWGDVPALLHPGRPIKGFRRANRTSGNESTGGFKCDPKDGKQWRGNSPLKEPFPSETKRETAVSSWKGCSKAWDNFHATGERAKQPGVTSRKEWSAKAAMIPEELAVWIGECFYPREVKTAEERL